MRERAARGSVIVIGELNVDAVATGLAREPKLGLEIIATDFQMTLGSASAIFASGVAKLGHEVTFVSKVGRDDFGDFCLEALGDDLQPEPWLLCETGRHRVHVQLADHDDAAAHCTISHQV